MGIEADYRKDGSTDPNGSPRMTFPSARATQRPPNISLSSPPASEPTRFTLRCSSAPSECHCIFPIETWLACPPKVRRPWSMRGTPIPAPRAAVGATRTVFVLIPSRFRHKFRSGRTSRHTPCRHIPRCATNGTQSPSLASSLHPLPKPGSVT